ncbi:hypothetical protein PINS_up023139 [Pythium insidiosum]|nr:hypothetical protein PINS_up009716 [Pythium insidiosum]GLE10864.1 hypothetical protein PINS_up023136 [Pythium insidiosum]GLE10867.1 hypothetical protein PINS_up023139 [Pythium insidiosum]
MRSLSLILALVLLLQSQLAKIDATPGNSSTLNPIDVSIYGCTGSMRWGVDPLIPSPLPVLFNFSQVNLPVGARLTMIDAETETPLAAIEPTNGSCTWLLVRPGNGFRVEYVPPPSNPIINGLIPSCKATYTGFFVNVSDFCATPTGAGMNPDGICDSISSASLSTARVLQDGTTCAPAKPGRRESPMDSTNPGCTLARDGCHRNASANGGAATSDAMRQLQGPLSLAPMLATALAALLMAVDVCM